MKQIKCFGNVFQVAGKGTKRAPYVPSVGSDLGCFVEALVGELSNSQSVWLNWKGLNVKIARAKTGRLRVIQGINEIRSTPDPLGTANSLILTIREHVFGRLAEAS